MLQATPQRGRTGGRRLGAALCMATATLAALLLAAPAAHAIYLAEDGQKARLYGPFELNDEKIFAAFLAKPRPAPLRVLYLESFGGSILSAVQIGRMVRKAGLATAVYADSKICDSACTLVFAAGVRRHYIHGETVFEGIGARSGLGYHPAYLRGDRVHFSIKSDTFVKVMNDFYAEMGAPRAAELVAKAGINSIYRPSGKTSLELRLATSLAEP